MQSTLDSEESQMRKHTELFDEVRRSPGMYLGEGDNYNVVDAFVFGYDLAHEGGILAGSGNGSWFGWGVGPTLRGPGWSCGRHDPRGTGQRRRGPVVVDGCRRPRPDRLRLSARGRARRPAAPPGAFVPCLRLATETVLVGEGDVLTSPRFLEEEAAVAELSFDYGGRLVRAGTPFLAAGGDEGNLGGSGPARDPDGERAARYLLESLGAVEIACLDEVSTSARARRPTTWCASTATSTRCARSRPTRVPQLRALGWRVEIAADYPYQVVARGRPLVRARRRRRARRAGSASSSASRSTATA